MSNSLTSVASAARAATMTHVSDVVKITICLLIFRSVVGCDRKDIRPVKSWALVHWWWQYD